MPLAKRQPLQSAETAPSRALGGGETPALTSQASAAMAEVSVTPPKRLGGTRKTGDKPTPHLSKEEYWNRKELRDIQRDKDMAWSGLAQAALESPYVCQFNTANTVDGLIELVAQVVEKLLARRNA